MNFQWYPGHMTKAKRQMQEDIKLIDLVIELVDARIPLSSRNPDIDELGKNKYRLILMNKADLADRKATEQWSAFFKKKGYYVVSLDARSKNGMKSITDIIMEACKEKMERDRKRGIKNRPVRAMVVGIPNVGKSTFINSYAGKACAKTGNKPGVTKGKQWIRLSKSVELLDTPGILWPKFEDQKVGLRLALIGSIRDEILNTDELAVVRRRARRGALGSTPTTRSRCAPHSGNLRSSYRARYFSTKLCQRLWTSSFPKNAASRSILKCGSPRNTRSRNSRCSTKKASMTTSRGVWSSRARTFTLRPTATK